MKKDSCVYCVYALYTPGTMATLYDPGSDDDYLCKVKTLKITDDQYNEIYEESNYEKLAEVCGCFSPVMISSCPQCGKVMNKKFQECNVFTSPTFDDPYPVCSVTCKNDADRIDRERFADY